jgi:hypothetical protein
LPTPVLARHLDLLFAHAVAGKVSGPAFRVGERRRDGVLLERDARLVARFDRDELGGLFPRKYREPFAEQPQPRGFGRVRLERAARRSEAALGRSRPRRHAREHARGVERIFERAMALLGAEQRAREGLEAQVRRVGVRDGQQVLGVEVGRAAERCVHVAREEVALELGVVRDDDPPGEVPRDAGHDLLEARRSQDIGVTESRESLDGTRQGPRRPHQTVVRRDARRTRIEKHQAELEDLSIGIAGKTGRLEIHDGDRSRRRQKGRQGPEVDAEIDGVALFDPERCVGARRRFRP